MSLPEPYYSRDGITIYCADCRDVLPHLPPVDLVLTDPPYPDMKGGYEHVALGGVSSHVSKSVTISGDLWNSDLGWMTDAWNAATMGMIVFCSYHSVAEVAQYIPNDRRVALLTWFKRNAPPTGANVPRHTTEFAWVFRKSPGLKWDAFTSTMLDVPNINAGCMATERFVTSSGHAIHPTQKPIALMYELLRVGGSSVLDPFMGTGTSVVAARNLGMSAIGIELDERYCEIAVKRLQQSVMRLEIPA